MAKISGRAQKIWRNELHPPESVVGSWLSINLRGSWCKAEQVHVGEVRSPMLGTGTSCDRLLMFLLSFSLLPLPTAFMCHTFLCTKSPVSCHNPYFSMSFQLSLLLVSYSTSLHNLVPGCSNTNNRS